MIKVDVISGFLGAGKTTLIKKLFESSFKNQKVALIENEFGEIGIDGTFLKDAGIEIKEINSGCICCSLVGNFSEALKELIDKYNPDRIIIEPSGVGKLSEVVNAVKNSTADVKINVLCTVVDGAKFKMYAKNFKEFYIDQIREANTIVISKTDKLSEEKVIEACEFVKEFNPTVTLITTPISELNGAMLLENLEDNVSLVDFLIEQVKKVHGEHHHHEHDHDCDCHEHHDHDCDCHEHHEHGEHCHHEHDHDCDCHEHHDHDCDCHEHHDHGEHHHHDHDCDCHEHHEHGEHCHCHHDHHHAEEVFDSWGCETPKSFTKEKLESVLSVLATNKHGVILRSKGAVKSADGGKWYYFDFVAGDYEIRLGEPDVIGKLCVIGSNLDKEKIKELFLRG